MTNKTKTIFDFYAIFGIQVGKEYHAQNISIQMCHKAFNIYEEEKDMEMKKDIWEISEKLSREISMPTPIFKN